MVKRIIFSDGGKGGSGKSTVAARTIEEGLRNDLGIYLIEGDSGIPDVGRRYKGFVNGARIPLQRSDAKDEAMVAFLGRVEQVFASHKFQYCVVNLPGGAEATFEGQSVELVEPTALALDAEIVTMYCIGPGEETIAALEASLDNGLCAISRTKIAILNEYLGNSNDFDWMQSPVRKRWMEAGGREFRLPRLLPTVRDRVRGLPGTLYGLVEGKDPGLTIVERSLVHRWLRDTQHITAAALGVPLQ